ncbi:MAG: enoyl-CoA hydratase/isomerase family protein [Leucobacter sp.]
MSENAVNIAEVVIDGPERNLLNPEVMAAVAEGLTRANEDPAVTGIILTGAGEVFCGGLDLGGIRAGGDPVEYARSLAELLKLIPKLVKPVAAVVNGDAVASGGSIVAACDFAVILPDALVGSYEVGVNVWPMVAQVPMIKRLGPRNAMENIGSGDPFTAQRAFELGLVNAVAPASELRGVAEAWLTRAARGAGVYGGRPFFYEIDELPYDAALDLSLEKFAAQFREA